MKNKQIQLFILPYAGGSAAGFKRLTDLIDDSIDTITVEYSGRGLRSREPLAESYSSLFEDAVDYCLSHRKTNLPYAVLGYSMGSVLAYELIAQNRIPGEVKHLFLAAEVSPKDRSFELRKVDNPTDENVLERAKQLGGIDERMLNNKRFASIYIRPMLSDYKHFFTYHYHEYSKKIETNATFLYCETDTKYEDVKRWEELITGNCDYYEMKGNHFFINQQYEEMAQIINKKLVSYMEE